MTNNIHPSAIIANSARLGKNVKIGPFSIIGPEVTIGDNSELKSHVVIEGRTTIGDSCVIYPFVSIGHAPQDLKYKGEASEVIIGNNNIIREYTTIHPGTEGGGGVTKVGSNGLFMIGTHIAHDCKVGDNAIFANNATLAGHVVVGDNVVIGGLAAVHQWVRIGDHAMIGGVSAVVEDVMPYATAVGERATLSGINMVGMKRRGFDKNEIRNCISAYKELFDDNIAPTLEQRIEIVGNKYSQFESVRQMIDFLQKDKSRAICKPKKEIAA